MMKSVMGCFTCWVKQKMWSKPLISIENLEFLTARSRIQVIGSDNLFSTVKKTTTTALFGGYPDWAEHDLMMMDFLIHLIHTKCLPEP
jgi:hypothetical protein